MRNEILQLVEDYVNEKMKDKKKFQPGKTNIPASFPELNGQDMAQIVKPILDVWITDGKQTEKFRRELCKATGTNHAILVNSGSSANFIATKALFDKFPGKLVITCAAGFPTTIAPIYQHGRIPIYVDIDPETLSPDIGQIAYLLDEYGKDVSGAILAHNMGFPFDERLVRKLLGNDRFLLVDACDCLGGGFMISGTFIPVGYWSDASTYSFFPAHHITCAEGGAITTNDPELAKDMDCYINWGRDCFCTPGQSNTCGKRFGYTWDKLPEGWDHKYTFTKLGYNMKMTEFQAALGYSQIQRLREFVESRQNNFMRLIGTLWRLGNYLFSVSYPYNTVVSPFGFPIFLKKKYSTLTNELIQYLEYNKISTRRVFGGNITRQPGFQNLPYVHKEIPGADFVMENGFWIGVGPFLTKEMIDYIGEVFENYFNERCLY